MNDSEQRAPAGRLHLKREPILRARLQAFAYQIEAVKAVRDREYAAIFHEQGLGKTKIALDVILYWLESRAVDTAVLVVKKGLVANWQREIQAHTHLSPRLITQDRRHNYYSFNSPARLVLTHYEAVKGEMDRFALFLKTRRVGFVLDEATKIKNPDSAVAKAFLQLAPLITRRVIMTGTPVANRPYDIWAQIRFLDHGASLGNDFEAFRREVDLSNDLAADVGAQRAFEDALLSIDRKIASFSVRETKASGVISLPEKVVERIPVQWESRQHDLYMQLRNDLRAVVIRDGIPREEEAEGLLKRLLRLVQIASNPGLVDDSYHEVPGKLSVLGDLVAQFRDAGEKGIVWTAFTENVDWLARELKPHGCCRVHGKLSMSERNASVQRFLADPCVRLMIATPGAAKEGLTLTVANHVVFFDRTFSLDDYLQAQDRIHRISQKKTCHIHNLIMEESIDEWVDVLLEAKRLAAQLAQGDISHDFYRSQMSYTFGEMLADVLGLESDTEEHVL